MGAGVASRIGNINSEVAAVGSPARTLVFYTQTLRVVGASGTAVLAGIGVGFLVAAAHGVPEPPAGARAALPGPGRAPDCGVRGLCGLGGRAVTGVARTLVGLAELGAPGAGAALGGTPQHAGVGVRDAVRAARGSHLPGARAPPAPDGRRPQQW